MSQMPESIINMHRERLKITLKAFGSYSATKGENFLHIGLSMPQGSLQMQT